MTTTRRRAVAWPHMAYLIALLPQLTALASREPIASVVGTGFSALCLTLLRVFERGTSDA